MSDSTSNRLVLLLCDDLIFTSRISGTARDLGIQVKATAVADTMLALAREQTAACLILDLGNSTLQIADFVTRVRALGELRPRIVAYGSHIDAVRLRAAREAGCDLVLPRSKFVEELPRALAEWVSDSANNPQQT